MKSFVCLTVSVIVMSTPAMAFRDGRGAACVSRGDCSSSTDECRPYIDGNHYCVARDEHCAWPGIVGVRVGTRTSLGAEDYVCTESREWMGTSVMLGRAGPAITTATTGKPTPHQARSSENTGHCSDCQQPGATQPITKPDERSVSRAISIPEVVIRATADAWIRVYDRYGSVVLSQVLKRGQSWSVPRNPNLLLTTGNAGGTQLVVGSAIIPSLGAANQVRRDIRLDPHLLMANQGG